MNKSDKYYMKQGKLELSMLDSDDEEEFFIQEPIKEQKKDLFADMEFPHSKKIREKKETKVKMSKDIYSTLQNMGQFLVKSEEADIAKAQKLAQIGMTLKVEDIELPPREVNKVPQANIDIEQVKITNENESENSVSNITQVQDKPALESMSRAKDIGLVEHISRDVGISVAQNISQDQSTSQDQNTSTDVTTQAISVSEPLAEYIQEEDPLEKTIGTTYENPQEIINRIREQNRQQEDKNQVDNEILEESNEAILNIEKVSLDDVYIPEEEDAELKQNQIDKILTLHFGRIRGNYPDAKILKAYIDEQIDKIVNYGN